MKLLDNLPLLRGFMERAADLLAGARFYAGVALLRSRRMADHARRLPGCLVPDDAYRQISAGGGVALATRLATELADMPGVDALHIYPLGDEEATREVAGAFRTARGVPAQRL